MSPIEACEICGVEPGKNNSAKHWKIVGRCGLCPQCRVPQAGDAELLAEVLAPRSPVVSVARPHPVRIAAVQPAEAPQPGVRHAGLLH